MDKGSIGGVLLAIAGIVAGLLIEGGNLGQILQPTAALIVFGGTMGAVCSSSRCPRCWPPSAAWRTSSPRPASTTTSSSTNWSPSPTRPAATASSRWTATCESIQDPFLKQALMLAVDGTEPNELRKIMRVSLDCTAENEERLPAVFESAGGFSPTIGILGAVLGLIQVMQHLDNIQEVGRGIAVAFVATIYGVGAANLFFLPFAGKMRIRMHDDHQRREMMLEGVISILEGMNPRMLEVKLAGFLNAPEPERPRQTGEADRACGMMRERRKGNISRDRWLVSYADFITLLFGLLRRPLRLCQSRSEEANAGLGGHRHGLPLPGHLLRSHPASLRRRQHRRRHRRAGPAHEHRHGRESAPRPPGQGRPEQHSPRAGPDARQPGRLAQRLHSDGPRRPGHQPARGRLLRLRLGHA